MGHRDSFHRGEHLRWQAAGGREALCTGWVHRDAAIFALEDRGHEAEALLAHHAPGDFLASDRGEAVWNVVRLGVNLAEHAGRDLAVLRLVRLQCHNLCSGPAQLLGQLLPLLLLLIQQLLTGISCFTVAWFPSFPDLIQNDCPVPTR